jgi:hypothetical protein
MFELTGFSTFIRDDEPLADYNNLLTQVNTKVSWQLSQNNRLVGCIRGSESPDTERWRLPRGLQRDAIANVVSLSPPARSLLEAHTTGGTHE